MREREREVSTVSSKRRLILIRRSFGEDQKSLSFSLGTWSHGTNKESGEEKEATAFRSGDVICTRGATRVSVVQTTDKHARCFVIAMWQKPSRSVYLRNDKPPHRCCDPSRHSFAKFSFSHLRPLRGEAFDTAKNLLSNSWAINEAEVLKHLWFHEFFWITSREFFQTSFYSDFDKSKCNFNCIHINYFYSFLSKW